MNKIFNIPNILTFSRIFMIPVLVILFFIESYTSSILILIIFILCCITDFLDGYIARIYKQTTKLGQILDPIADKALISTSILFLVGFDKISKFSIIPCIIIMCREVMISEIRDVIISSKISFKTSKTAKWKTTFQMFAISIILLSNTFQNNLKFPTLYTGETLLWISSIIAIISGIAYYQRYWKSMT